MSSDQPLPLIGVQGSKIVGSILLVGILFFTYALLRLFEYKNTIHILRNVEVDVSATTVVSSTPRSTTPSLKLPHKDHCRLIMQTLATVGFSCHTYPLLPINLIGILLSGTFILSCLWQRQLNYAWLSAFDTYHLIGTLSAIVCLTTVAVTLIVWAIQDHGYSSDKEVLEGYVFGVRFVGSLSMALVVLLTGAWVHRRLSRMSVDAQQESVKHRLIEI